MCLNNAQNGTVTPTVSGLNYDKAKYALVESKFAAQSFLYRALFLDIATISPNSVSSDFAYLLTRMIQEGNQFFLERLPELGKSLEVSMVTCLALDVPDGWKLQKGTRLPKFLYSLWNELYNVDGSHKYNYECGPVTSRAYHALLLLRQCTMMWSKVEYGMMGESLSTFSPLSREGRALDDFRNRMCTLMGEIPSEYHTALNNARRLLQSCVFAYDTFAGASPRIRYESLGETRSRCRIRERVRA